MSFQAVSECKSYDAVFSKHSSTYLYLEQLVDDFKNSIDLLKQNNELKDLLKDEQLFHDFFKHFLFTKEHLEYILEVLTDFEEFESFCLNTSILRYILENFVIDSSYIRFSEIFKELKEKKQIDETQTVSKFIEQILDQKEKTSQITHNERLTLQYFNELNKWYALLSHFNFNEKDKQKISQILMKHKKAQKRFLNLIEYHLKSSQQENQDKPEPFALLSCKKLFEYSTNIKTKYIENTTENFQKSLVADVTHLLCWLLFQEPLKTNECML